jgi:hypothetical protein
MTTLASRSTRQLRIRPSRLIKASQKQGDGVSGGYVSPIDEDDDAGDGTSDEFKEPKSGEEPTSEDTSHGAPTTDEEKTKKMRGVGSLVGANRTKHLGGKVGFALPSISICVS